MGEKVTFEAGSDSICDAFRFCAAASRFAQEDPIGSATELDRYLLAEVPLPWESPVADSRYFPAGLKEVLKEATGQGKKFRFLAFSSDSHPSRQGFRRMMYFERPSKFAGKLSKSEYVVPEGELLPLAAALLQTPERRADFDAYKQDAADVRDLFVCTHGTHDVCCGKLGSPIYKLLEEKYVAESDGELRVWRASHFGGHRYAPTIADLPEGRYWSHIEASDLDALVYREGGISYLSRKYRGRGGLGVYEQVLEREILIREGWKWVDFGSSASSTALDERTARVVIEFRVPDGSIAGSYEGIVEAFDTVRIGGCGTEDREVPQYRVKRIEKYPFLPPKEVHT